MTHKPYLLGIDQGTSGSRALILDKAGQVRGYAYRPLARIYPQPGWVEQDPQAVTAGIQQVIAGAIDKAGCSPNEIAACGIACQRNTDFAWDAATAQPLANAITWQDLRTLPLVAELETWEWAGQRRQRLGYFPGPYSSAMHLAWRMKHSPQVQAAAKEGRLRVGPSSTWLMVALGHPSGHVADFSLVQAMGLYDFRAGRYWPEWLHKLGVPQDALPAAVPTVHEFGGLRVSNGRGSTALVPVLATIGDQQAALFGHGCHRPGDAECTHGTASFVDVFAGRLAPDLDRINVYHAWTGLDGLPTFCMEADTTVTGAAIRWMREEARWFQREDEIDGLAQSVPDSGGVVFVPAFSGLNVPYNDPKARGTILGLTLGTTRAHIVRAFLEALGYQLRAVLETIREEVGLQVDRLHLGGGVSASNVACQIQADLLGIPTIRSDFAETTCLAAAWLAGLGAGHWQTLADLPPGPPGRTTFQPRLDRDQRDHGYARWQRAIARAMQWTEE